MWTGRWNRQEETKKTDTWGSGPTSFMDGPKLIFFFIFFYSSNPRVPCHSLPYLDLSHWREEVTQCRVNGLDIILGSSKKISPCTSCTCTKEGVIIIIFSKNIRARKKEKKLWNDSKIKFCRVNGLDIIFESSKKIGVIFITLEKNPKKNKSCNTLIRHFRICVVAYISTTISMNSTLNLTF